MSRMYSNGVSEIQVLQNQNDRNGMILPAIITIMLQIAIMVKSKVEINRNWALLLITIYAGYLTWSLTVVGVVDKID